MEITQKHLFLICADFGSSVLKIVQLLDKYWAEKPENAGKGRIPFGGNGSLFRGKVEGVVDGIHQ